MARKLVDAIWIRQRMARLLTLVALLLSAVPVSAQTPSAARPCPCLTTIGVTPYGVLLAGSGLDLGTTLKALQQPGTREGNPLLAHGGTPGLVAGKVATTAALVWVMYRLSHSGHPRAATVIGWTGGIALTSIAIRNTRVGQ
jgi:hypothetical protein